MTGEDLFLRPDLEPCELVGGRVVPLAPTGYVQGFVQAKLSSELDSWAEQNGQAEHSAAMLASTSAGTRIRSGPQMSCSSPTSGLPAKKPQATSRRKVHAYRSPTEVEQFGEGQALMD